MKLYQVDFDEGGCLMDEDRFHQPFGVLFAQKFLSWLIVFFESDSVFCSNSSLLPF